MLSAVRAAIALMVVSAIAAAAAPAQSGAPRESTLFTYDARAPLNARTFDRMDSAAFVREKLVFDGWRGSRVPGFVAVPRTFAVRHPVIVLVDGLGGWKERWWQPTSWNRGKVLIDSLLRSGFAVAMVDAPASGERTFENDYQTAETFVRRPDAWREMGIRNAIELRRLIDYLATRPDIDTSRLGMLGLSHGGMMTFVLAAVEPRVRAGVAGLTPLQNIPDELLPDNYAPRIRVPFLMMVGRTDAWYTQAQVDRALASLGTAQKELLWYEVGHRVPESYAADATRWFRTHLGTASQERVDLLIRGGTVVDGTGSEGRVTDVGIRGDRITFVGDASRARISASRTIDAAGLVVAPGFIDPHTHTGEDLSNAQRKSNLPYLMQGVTTVVTNNDGGGPVNVGAQIGGWRQNGIGTNAAVYVGHGSVRRAVLGMSDRPPTAAQLDSMRGLVARAMDDGAIGLSTGLYYAPGSYATTEEVIELAKVAAARGGAYDSHIRDESSYTVGLLASIAEVIRIGREARLPVHVSHIKALGADVWGKSDSVIAMIRDARAAGVDVTASQYPYTASGTGVGASLLPRWAEAGGRDSLRARVADTATRARLIREMRENLRRRGGAATLLITSSRDTTIRGKRLNVIARERGVLPVEAGLQIILAGDASVASFNMTEADIQKLMVQDFVFTDSDGSGGHPRKYGTFPKLLREYVYTKGVLTLPQAIRRSSAASAAFLGFTDRGTIREGAFADVIVFDPKTISDRATYEEPTRLATGMRYVLVNGVLAIDGATPTGALAGRVLQRNR
ncbi:MAG TPA: amidohydrolase family protein [Gemmatimonadaceae bacterium]|nr:amidohydrolase family protein [Gemmatimonadaceae bacterium]